MAGHEPPCAPVSSERTQKRRWGTRLPPFPVLPREHRASSAVETDRSALSPALSPKGGGGRCRHRQPCSARSLCQTAEAGRKSHRCATRTPPRTVWPPERPPRPHRTSQGSFGSGRPTPAHTPCSRTSPIGSEEPQSTVRARCVAPRGPEFRRRAPKSRRPDPLSVPHREATKRSTADPLRSPWGAPSHLSGRRGEIGLVPHLPKEGRSELDSQPESVHRDEHYAHPPPERDRQAPALAGPGGPTPGWPTPRGDPARSRNQRLHEVGCPRRRSVASGSHGPRPATPAPRSASVVRGADSRTAFLLPGGSWRAA